MTVSTRLCRYRLYGATVSSTVPLPELVAVPDSEESSPADLHFEMTARLDVPSRRHTVLTMTSPDGTLWLSGEKTERGFRLRFPGLAEFDVVEDGALVRCAAHPGTPPETTRHLLLDQIVPLLLNLRGSEALHASVVLISRGACAFIGKSGRGKSTLAAAFQRVGTPVLSDDCLVLAIRNDRVMVEPAYPGLRLWADAMDALCDSRTSHQPVSHYTSKQRIVSPEPGNTTLHAHPVCAVYALTREEEDSPDRGLPRIEPLSLRDGVMELVASAFRLDLGDRAMLLRQMHLLERVVRLVPVKRLRIPTAFDALPAVCELIRQDAGCS